MLKISSNLASSVCQQYEQEGVVCPPKLKRHVFTTAAADNIDHNPSSNTSLDSFHGTAVSLTNHMSTTCTGTPRPVINITTTAPEDFVTDLPQQFAVVPPASLKTSHPRVPLTEGPVKPTEKKCHDTMGLEHEWLSKVEVSLSKAKLEEGDFLHWSAYHAQRQRE